MIMRYARSGWNRIKIFLISNVMDGRTERTKKRSQTTEKWESLALPAEPSIKWSKWNYWGTQNSKFISIKKEIHILHCSQFLWHPLLPANVSSWCNAEHDPWHLSINEDTWWGGNGLVKGCFWTWSVGTSIKLPWIPPHQESFRLELISLPWPVAPVHLSSDWWTGWTWVG